MSNGDNVRATIATASYPNRTAAGPLIGSNPRPRASRMLFHLFVIVLTVGLGAVWTVIAQRQLVASVALESAEHLQLAHKAFAQARTRSQADLQGYCRILVEDPRLKSTLATEGIDAATVADILSDLGKLRGSGFLMVLSPEGRVFAEAGATELRGMDLSDSGVVKKAQGAVEAVVGSWVLSGKVMDLSIMAIRFGDDILAYLVVGQSVDEKVLQQVAEQTGVDVASSLANTVVLSSSSDGTISSVLARVAGESGGFSGRVLTIEGSQYVTGVVELGETAQSHRLVVVRALATARTPFEPLNWMLFVPPLLVLIAVLFSMFGTRSTRRNS